MTKEFENFQQILAQKQNELDIQAKNTKKAQDDKVVRKQEEARQKQIESEQRAAENKRIFENYGVVRLLEKIRDTGTIKSNEEPLYASTLVYHHGHKERVFDKSKKLNNFTPATIIWGDENKFIELRFNGGYGSDSDRDSYYVYDYFRLDLLNNKRIGTIKTIEDPDDKGYSSGVGRGSRWVYKYIDQETEITNIPEYIASKIINPDHHPLPTFIEAN